tara:strand:+ start:145 stop:900 length:756 start_codon:yes stop_codon:yes gene_type:complete
MIISPIYEDRRSVIEAKELKSGMTFSIIICFVLILLPFFIAEGISEPGAGYGFYIILSWLVAPFVGFGNLIGKIQKRNVRENFNREYEEIFNKYKEIAKKKVNAKDVDKIAKQLETENFSYLEVLDILVYHEGLDEHHESLKKKKIKDIADDKVTKKKGEKICFKTHVIWSQGSPDHHVIKDVGDLYLTNKRIIFLGQIKSYSVNFTRITNFENGDNYIQIQKTAGTNDIYEIYSKASANYAYFLYNKFNK